MLLNFSDVSFSYDKKTDVLKGISFSINDGEKVALLGLNGSGKSTLMLHTNGLLVPYQGKVFVKGISTDSKSIKDIRKFVGLVFQNPDDQLFMPTVWDDVAFGPSNMKISKEEIDKRVRKALEMTGTLNLAHKSPFELSGGQKKAVSIATVLSMSPELLILDEPTSGLDYEAVENLVSILKNFSQAILLSTHDMELARRLCNRAIVLEKGEIKYDGKIDELIYPPVI